MSTPQEVRHVCDVRRHLLAGVYVVYLGSCDSRWRRHWSWLVGRFVRTDCFACPEPCRWKSDDFRQVAMWRAMDGVSEFIIRCFDVEYLRLQIFAY